MIDNRSAKHPAEQETVDGRSADECLGARTAGVPQGLARGTFGGILSPFGRVRLARDEGPLIRKGDLAGAKESLGGRWRAGVA